MTVDTLQGHIICSSCRPKLRSCPQCRGRLQDGARLYFAERLLEKVPAPCRYSTEGCTVELVTGRLEQHEAECQYREVTCPHQGCGAVLPRRGLEDHQARCSSRPVRCPVSSCKVLVPHRLVMGHLSSQHNVRQESLQTNLLSFNSLLKLLLVLSVAINISVLFF